MLRRTSSWFVHYTLARKAIGLAIFVSGSAVIVVYLLRRVSDG
ncbi:hypothetical protein OKW43_008100 [Paraburkholderia sp. WC7.3g]